MANNDFFDYSTAAGSVTDVGGTDITGATGKLKDGDNTIRELAAQSKRYVSDMAAVNTVGGTGDAVTLTSARTIAALATGIMLRFIAGAANTTAATLTVNALAAKAIRKISGGTDVALVAGDLAAGETYTVVYRSAANSAAGAWVIVGAAGAKAATNAEVLTGTSSSVFVSPATAYFPTGHLWGLTLSNNGVSPTSKIDVAVGTCRDSTDASNIILAGALTAKDLTSAWAVGSSAGLLATGVAVANGTYHIFLIKRPDTGVVDVAADSSATGANIATNTNAAYTLKRRIGSIVRSGGSILAFSQNGDEFLYLVPVVDVNSTNPGTSAVTQTLSSIPTGVKFGAVVTVMIENTGTGVNFAVVLSSLDITDTAPSISASMLIQTSYAANSVGNAKDAGVRGFTIRTNTSAQIRSRAIASDASCILRIQSDGWIDTRGRLA